MVVTSSNLSNEMSEFNNQTGYKYSILEVSDISLIILLDKEAHINNITLIIWEIEKIFWLVKKVLLKMDYTNRYSNEASETAYKFFKYANVSTW